MDYNDNTPFIPPDEDCWGDEDDDRCETCGGDGWGIVGTDWDCDDGVNGPFDGQVARCPDCRGSGKVT